MDENKSEKIPQFEKSETVNPPVSKKSLKKRMLPWILLLGVLLIAVGVLWLQSAINKYRNTNKYKESYDIVQQELKYCSERKFDNKDATVQVHYCDEFNNKFKSIERE